MSSTTAALKKTFVKLVPLLKKSSVWREASKGLLLSYVTIFYGSLNLPSSVLVEFRCPDVYFLP